MYRTRNLPAYYRGEKSYREEETFGERLLQLQGLTFGGKSSTEGLCFSATVYL